RSRDCSGPCRAIFDEGPSASCRAHRLPGNAAYGASSVIRRIPRPPAPPAPESGRFVRRDNALPAAGRAVPTDPLKSKGRGTDIVPEALASRAGAREGIAAMAHHSKKDTTPSVAAGAEALPPGYVAVALEPGPQGPLRLCVLFRPEPDAAGGHFVV